MVSPQWARWSTQYFNALLHVLIVSNSRHMFKMFDLFVNVTTLLWRKCEITDLGWPLCIFYWFLNLVATRSCYWLLFCQSFKSSSLSWKYLCKKNSRLLRILNVEFNSTYRFNFIFCTRSKFWAKCGIICKTASFVFPIFVKICKFTPLSTQVYVDFYFLFSFLHRCSMHQALEFLFSDIVF